MSDVNVLLGNVESKIGTLPLQFDMDNADLEPCLGDALREMHISDVGDITPNSDTELYVEIRTTWYFLFRLRNSNLGNFKYSTGSDNGRQVDKSMITATIDTVMDDLNTQFGGWHAHSKSGSSTGGGMWNRTIRQSDQLQGS